MALVQLAALLTIGGPLIGATVADTVEIPRPKNCIRPLPTEGHLFCDGIPRGSITEEGIDEVHIRIHDCSRIMQAMIYFMDLRQVNPEIQSYVIDDCLKIQEYYQITNHSDIMNASLYTLLSIFIVILLRMLEKLASWYFRKKASQQQAFEMMPLHNVPQAISQQPLPAAGTITTTTPLSPLVTPTSKHTTPTQSTPSDHSASTQASFPPNYMYAAASF